MTTLDAVKDLELIDPHGCRWRVEVPRTRRERARGLRGRGSLPPRHAMLFRRCRSVHTVGMRFEIAVVALDASFRVIDRRRLRPGRIALPRPRVRHILECAVDADLRPGDRLEPAPGYTLSAAP